ncbi:MULTISPECIES: response regulator transcription factor [Paenibacillaceae]|uniref:Response regulator n=1 Tax=Marinicrinis lubricantis TaxID=2086470 RepID=A0ABW1IU71_9BACL|nr:MULTISPECIES: response regulator transcription factor [Paenibacillus]MED4599713.1 response regulator transcription factor [Paenibacillus validus]MED4604854.1 response regulator transcription factor [Paenibacillus validus]NTZ19076.1 response regulator transcription factor [Paenibacillus sp. JMULE4]
MKSILIVDDEEKIRDVISSYLVKEGYNVVEAGTGIEALSFIESTAIDLVILDLMLPDIPGEEVCQKIRQQSSVPILMLTAKVSENNRIQGLSLGADDYLIKPFDVRELVARVRAILRRSDDSYLLADRVSFNDGELIIDVLRHEVYLNGAPIVLTPNEYKLLMVLARHPQRHFTREELVEKVYGFDYAGDVRSIDQHVKNLRQKIEPDPKKPEYIVTLYGVGYRFMGGTR